MKKHTRKIIAVGSAAAISLVMAVPAFAATPTKQHEAHGLIGTVASISGSTIMLSAKNGTAYVVDAASATVKKGIGKEAEVSSLSAISVGSKIAVRGTLSGTTETAKVVNYDLPAEGLAQKAHTLAKSYSKNVAFGTVASVSGNQITLTQKNRETTSTVTITTTAQTTYKKNGVADVASDISVGSRIVAFGTKDSSGNITDATSVNLMVQGAKAVK